MTVNIEQYDSLLAYLHDNQHLPADEVPAIEVLQGGVSNKTVLVRRASGEAWVLKQALAKLRVQADWFSSPERIHREAMGLRRVADLLPDGAVPRVLFEDHALHILAMTAVPQPHANWKQMLLRGELRRVHVETFGRILGALHRGAAEKDFSADFQDYGFFETLRLSPYYEYTAEQVPQAAAFIAHLLDDTRATRVTFVHGDYSPKNVLIYQDQLVLLDFEVAHWGDPAFDVGFSTTHLLSKAHHVRQARAEFIDAARAYWSTYSALVAATSWSGGLEARSVRHTLACSLARVAGKSPLEYLSDEERQRQRTVVLGLMQSPPPTMPLLFDRFHAELDDAED